MNWKRPSALSLLLCIASACDGDDHGEDHHHADEATDADTTGGETGEVDLANGQMIHDGTCMVAGCHADNGELLSEHVPEHTDAQLTDIIGNGTDLMPAQSQLSAQDIQDVIAYVRMLYG